MVADFIPSTKISTNGHSADSHLHAHHHLPRAAALSLKEIKADIRKVEGFNAKLAVGITGAIGSMACAYIFSFISLVSLPAVLVAGGFVPHDTFPSWLIRTGVIALIAWFAQTFLQLVLLSVIMVGQQVQSASSDARAQQTYDDTVLILDRLDINTQGGITHIRDDLAVLRGLVEGK